MGYSKRNQCLEEEKNFSHQSTRLVPKEEITKYEDALGEKRVCITEKSNYNLKPLIKIRGLITERTYSGGGTEIEDCTSRH